MIPKLDINAELLAGVREAEAAIAGKATRRPPGEPVPPEALTDVQVPGDRVAGIVDDPGAIDDPEEVVDLEEVVARLAVDLAGMHNERDRLRAMIAAHFARHVHQTLAPDRAWQSSATNISRYGSREEAEAAYRKAEGLDTGDPEPPSPDIYAGREPFEGRGIPAVPGTPEYAPEPPWSSTRHRRRKGGAS